MGPSRTDKREVDIAKILDAFFYMYAYGYFSSASNIEKYWTVNMLMSLRTQQKRTRIKCIWLWRSVVHCYVMNLVYNHDRTMSQKPRPLSVHKSWYAHVCIVTTHILLLPQWVSKRAAVNDWGYVFDQNLWKLNSSGIIFRDVFVHIENYLYQGGDLNNNDNIGFPFLEDTRKY